MTTFSFFGHLSLSWSALAFGGWVLPPMCGPTCNNLFSSLPPLLHDYNNLQPPHQTHPLGSLELGTCTLPLTLALQPCPHSQGTGELLAPGSLHPMTAPPEVSPPLISIGQRRTQTLISVLSESPAQGCETKLFFSRQHPLTALRKWLVPISCWRLFNHLTWFFNFHCSCPYISILANGMPQELSSSNF